MNTKKQKEQIVDTPSAEAGDRRTSAASKATLRRRFSWWIVGMVTFGLIATTADASEAVTFYHWDALGSPVAATDEAGNIEWREQYRPYGERVQNEATAHLNTRWYTGHPHDNATGLTYAGARYYDPVIGRFMGVDPKPLAESNIHSFNRYAYGNNNPYRYVDPNGRWAEDIVIGVPSLIVGAHSAWGNAKAGNWGALAVDALGMLGDAAAIVAPGVPGGVGLGIKAAREGAEAVANNGNKLALGISEHLDDFAKRHGASTWENFPDPTNWKPTMIDKLADSNTKILFNLDGVDVWRGVSRSAAGRGGATDWELLQIKQNPQWWNTIEWHQGGRQVSNPFQ